MLVQLSILGMITPRIGIIGEFDQKFPLHLATNEAIQHGFARHGVEASVEWLPTTARHDLSGFDGFWCSPGWSYNEEASPSSPQETAEARVVELPGFKGAGSPPAETGSYHCIRQSR
jgi:hypothetical protein